MANRSYLYATDHLPGSPQWQEKPELHGISEWNYAIPLTFKLLLSGNTRAVKSSIWDTEQTIAIVGDFTSGCQALNRYLARLPREVASLVTEAQDFLSQPANKRDYFILECGEIFDLLDEPWDAQNQVLLEDIRTSVQDIAALDIPEVVLPDKPRKSFLSHLFRKPPPTPIDPLQPFYEMGLGYWSNTLYFDFSKEFD